MSVLGLWESVARVGVTFVLVAVACSAVWIAWHEVEYLRVRVRVWLRGRARRARRGWLDGRGRL